MDYPPNINAAVWFCENVLGRLHPAITFVIVGAKPTRRVRNLALRYENVQVTGFVEDPYTILKSALCVVAPMQTGGGIQNKILEAMALGAVVVTTSKAAVPIIGSSAPNTLIVRDGAAATADVINDIARDRRPYAETAARAREYIRSNFTWSIYEDKIKAVLNGCLSSPLKNTSRRADAGFALAKQSL
jgi:glycosyltransferase involved in cell wall biosynthesis